MTKTTKSFAELCVAANLMAQEAAQHLDVLGGVGISESDVNALLEKTKSLSDENAKQEQLKSALKVQTKIVEDKTSEVAADYSRFKKVVKLTMPQETWRGFGIGDKK